MLLARQARQRGWWTGYDFAGAHSELAAYVGLESDASEIRSYDLELIPGLLQRPSYTRRLLMESHTDDQIESLLRLRLRRQREVFDRQRPADATFVLDEHVLHRQVSDPHAMHDQLAYLIRVAQGRVELRLLPFSAGIIGASGSFHIFDFPEDPTGIAIHEILAGLLTFDQPSTVDAFRRSFDRLLSQSLSRAATIDILRRQLEDLNRSLPPTEPATYPDTGPQHPPQAQTR